MEEGKKESESKKTSSTKKYVVIGLVIVLLVGIALAIYFIVQAAVQPPPPQLGSFSKPGSSCLQLLHSGINKNGFYFLKAENIVFEVYCDMTTSGGGWTLVANVHQFDNVGQCTSQNMWYGNSTSEISRNWENDNIFGQLSTATSSDYKNLGYFSLKASNIMIRHLANNYSVLESEKQTTLQYHTENDFLNKSGGNLYQTFKQFYPLTPTSPEEQLGDEEPSVLEQMLDALEAKGSDILSVDIPTFYEYVYDDVSPDRLSNGGNNLFDPYGMKISITGPNCLIDGISYGQTYSQCGNLTSRRNYPFFALLHTKPESTEQYLYTIDSRRPVQGIVSNDSYGLIFNDAAVQSDLYVMYYQTHCDLSDAVPSYCDMTFTVLSPDVWNSTYILDVEFRNNFKSRYANAVYGYTMIARNPGNADMNIPTMEFARRILNTLETFSMIDIESMMNALVENSTEIANVTQPPPYRYQYEDGNPDQDRLSDDDNLFMPYGMKVSAFTPNGSHQSVEYGKSYKFVEDLTEISSRRSYPFFALMKLNNPSLHQAAAFMATGARSTRDREERERFNFYFDSIRVGNFSLQYYGRCSYSLTSPSICDIIFTVTNEQEWKTQNLSFSNQTVERGENVTGSDYEFYHVYQQSKHTNAILGYTLLSRSAVTIAVDEVMKGQPGNIGYDFPLLDIMRNMLSAFTGFSTINFPCSNPNRNLVTPVKFTAGFAFTLGNRIPRKFQPYTLPGVLQLRAATFSGDYYAMCPGVRVNSCEPQYLCIGGVTKAQEQICNAYFEWPSNGTSYTDPGRPYDPIRFSRSISDNVMIFYR